MKLGICFPSSAGLTGSIGRVSIRVQGGRFRFGSLVTQNQPTHAVPCLRMAMSLRPMVRLR